jgi:hypothetical protein
MGGMKCAVKEFKNSMKIIIGIVQSQNKFKLFRFTMFLTANWHIFNDFKR